MPVSVGNQSVLYTGISWAIIAFLTIWTIATTFRLNKRFRTWLQDRIGVGIRFIPSYRFFAPDPGKYDFHLLYRAEKDDGSVTRWKECEELNDLPMRLHWIWNPQMYDTKAMFDYAQNLTSFLRDGLDEDMEEDDESMEKPAENLRNVDIKDYILTTPYMALLNYVSGRPDDDAEQVQFVLMRGSLRDEDSEPVFVSYFHDL